MEIYQACCRFDTNRLKASARLKTTVFARVDLADQKSCRLRITQHGRASFLKSEHEKGIISAKYIKCCSVRYDGDPNHRKLATWDTSDRQGRKCERFDSIRLESTRFDVCVVDSSPGSRFARHLEKNPQFSPAFTCLPVYGVKSVVKYIFGRY